MKFIYFEGGHNEPNILAKLMMIDDCPILKTTLLLPPIQKTQACE